MTRSIAFPSACIAALAALAPLSGLATTLFNWDFTGDTIGQQPTGFTTVLPTTNTEIIGAEVVAFNDGKALRLYDFGTNRSSAEQVFNTGYGQLRVDMTFQPNFTAESGSSPNSFFLTLMRSDLSLAGAANRAFDIRLNNFGEYRFSGTVATTLITTFDPAVPNTLTLFANSSGSSILYEGADGQTRNLDAYSVVVYLNETLAGNESYLLKSGYVGQDNLLEKLAIFTGQGGGDLDIDFLIDHIAVSTFEAIPEPSTYALLAGLALLGFAAYRRGKATLR